MIEGLADVQILSGIAPFVIPAILAGIDLISRAKGGQRQVENANRIGEANFDADIYRTLAPLLPQVGREQQLDPVRNAVIADLGGEFFPGVDASIFEGIRSAGPRPSVPNPPSFQGLKVPSFGSSLLTAGVNPNLIASIIAGTGTPGAPGAPPDQTRLDPEDQFPAQLPPGRKGPL